jgi:hypothetical protein
MPYRKHSARTGTNTPGHVTVRETHPQEPYKREDFFRDLKKVAKKQDRPSQRDSERR